MLSVIFVRPVTSSRRTGRVFAPGRDLNRRIHTLGGLETRPFSTIWLEGMRMWHSLDEFDVNRGRVVGESLQRPI